MPCDSEYLNATPREAESRNVAQLLMYVQKQLRSNHTVEVRLQGYVTEAAGEYYGNEQKLDEMTAQLCGLIRRMTKEQQKEIVYNGYSEKSRRLADWWERHQRYDRKREQREAAAAKRKKLIESALEKLTKEEREALGH